MTSERGETALHQTDNRSTEIEGTALHQTDNRSTEIEHEATPLGSEDVHETELPEKLTARPAEHEPSGDEKSRT